MAVECFISVAGFEREGWKGGGGEERDGEEEDEEDEVEKRLGRFKRWGISLKTTYSIFLTLKRK